VSKLLHGAAQTAWENTLNNDITEDVCHDGTTQTNQDLYECKGYKEPQRGWTERGCAAPQPSFSSALPDLSMYFP